jgi:hypothetical protein
MFEGEIDAYESYFLVPEKVSVDEVQQVKWLIWASQA